MATQRYISTSFWDDPWITTLEPDEKYLYLYLLTNTLTNIAGVYQIALKRMIFDTGLQCEAVKETLKKFEKNEKAYYKSGYIILPNWPKHQRITERDNNRKGIDGILSCLPDEIFNLLIKYEYRYGYMKGLIEQRKTQKAPYKPLVSPSNYLDSDTDTDTDINLDAGAKSLSSENPEEDDIDFDTPTREQRCEKARKTWNTGAVNAGTSEYKLTLLNLGTEHPDKTKILNGLSIHSDDEIEQAIKQYQRLKADPKYKVFPDNFRFPGFLERGVDQYVETAKPAERCKIRGSTPDIPQRDDHYIPPVVTDEEWKEADKLITELTKKKKFGQKAGATT